MELTIPFSTVFMACLGFLGVYVLVPFALACRDLIILKLIEKYLLNEKFFKMLSENTRAKACNNTVFVGKALNVGFRMSEPFYTFGDKEINKAEYERLEKMLNRTQKILDITTPVIQTKITRMVTIDKYYKLDTKLLDIVNEQVEKMYQSEVERLNNVSVHPL